MNGHHQILAWLETNQEIPKALVLGWMASEDITILGALYKFTDVAWDRIHPRMQKEEICHFILRYLKKCMIENPEAQEYVFNRYEAGWEMASWIKHLWSKKPETNPILQEISATLKAMYLQGDTAIRECIVNAVLEHAFEEKAIVDLFAEWQQDEQLKTAYQNALEWGRQYWS